jgi:mycothiol synthase
VRENETPHKSEVVIKTKISQKPYTGQDDQLEMLNLARQFQADTLHVIDLPYRLSSWALDDPLNIGLWFDESHHLIAWAVMQTPFWTIDYMFNPHLETELHHQILAWADQRALNLITTPYGHPSWFVNVFADLPERKSALEQVGFASQENAGEDSCSTVWMERKPAIKIPPPILPAGFTIRSLAGESEAEAYVELHQQVFETKNMTLEWRLRTLGHADYHPDLDVVCIEPGGTIVAFCIGWLFPIPGGGFLGQIEPLGCHSSYRKNALGKAVLRETLRRMRAHGAERIFVETDNYRTPALRLYESVGFQVAREVLSYRKDYNHA